MYAKISNNQLIQYPANPRLDNPYVSFPDNWGGGVINDQEYVLVQPRTPPVPDLGWTITERSPILSDGVWRQTWETTLLNNEGLKNAVTNKRYAVEVGNTRVANNIYSTDRESQTKYVAVAVEISQSNAESFSITWKTADSQFVTLNAPEMLEVINGVRAHVQNCFNKEAEYYNLIDTANAMVLASTDFSAGWPSNV
jgi:hypothetical protein